MFQKGIVSVELARAVSLETMQLRSAGPVEVVMMHVTVPPGESIDWHYHPGPVIVMVHTGTLTRVLPDGEVRTSVAGEAFVEAPGREWAHQGHNRGSEPLEMYAAFLLPHGQPLSIAI
ncbi:cupin domain-containing protein [Kibdelosporangium aridum]|uniref:Cupin domain-containing protein n=1 Tax=Kibdelosporangium aridum TaxID=2030 RepID=A0A1Y5Y6K5_KIBAR|nr:cupin domain-containing protein [Kibdelosporangium aridum]SMD26327.1 Cupin domain-containing protein [Kibdelosporangium aridum]